MHPHTMRLFPPPWLTVGVVVLSESGAPFSFQVYTLPSDPILLIFVSYDHRTLFQSSTVQVSSFWENLRWFCQWACLSSGHYCLTTEWKFLCLSAFLTVWGQTREGRMLMMMMKWVAWVALSNFPVMIWWIIDCVSQEESCEGWPPLLLSLSEPDVVYWSMQSYCISYRISVMLKLMLALSRSSGWNQQHNSNMLPLLTEMLSIFWLSKGHLLLLVSMIIKFWFLFTTC